MNLINQFEKRWVDHMNVNSDFGLEESEFTEENESVEEEEVAATPSQSNGAEQKLCVACLEKSTHAAVPCGHQCLCATCLMKYQKKISCPSCRGKVSQWIHIY